MTQLLQRTRAISFAYRAVRLHEAALAEFSVEGWDIAREFNYVYLDTPYSAQCVEWFDAFRTHGGDLPPAGKPGCDGLEGKRMQ